LTYWQKCKIGRLFLVVSDCATQFLLQNCLGSTRRKYIIYSCNSFSDSFFWFADNAAAQYTGKPTQSEWRRGLSKAEDIFANLIEHTVYGKLHDSAIRQGLKNGKTAEEIIGYMSSRGNEVL